MIKPYRSRKDVATHFKKKRILRHLKKRLDDFFYSSASGSKTPDIISWDALNVDKFVPGEIAVFSIPSSPYQLSYINVKEPQRRYPPSITVEWPKDPLLVLADKLGWMELARNG